LENLKLNINNILRKRTLIVGDIGSGKTKLTAQIVKNLIDKGFSSEITVIDMAPQRKGIIGGKISEYIDIKTIRYLNAENVQGPRITAKTTEELFTIAENNKRIIEPLLNHYLNNPTEILVINDLTLYLHKGSPIKIIQCITKSKTFVGNAYQGTKLSRNDSKEFDKIESDKLLEIIKIIDYIIKL
jgi:DNA replication protein DnaC